MEKVIILGSANAVPDENHENSHLVVKINSRAILIDCVGNPISNLKKAQVNIQDLSDIILTHFHPDHVSGFPLLLLDMWLLGRKDPINVYGLEHTITRAQKMMDLFDWDRWPGFFTVNYIVIEDKPKTEVFSDKDVRLITSPVKHLIPTIGLRFEMKQSGAVFVYSSDTEPTDSVIELANGADVLIHEANGLSIGHSSREQCGLVATQAGVKHLYLIHYPTDSNLETIINEAKTTFNGPVFACTDLMGINLD